MPGSGVGKSLHRSRANGPPWDGKHLKVLTMNWMGDVVDLVTFRRGEWEAELLAMSRPAVAH